MPRKIVDTILPTTMVGSYPRPDWYDYQLLGRDVRVAFKHVGHAEAYNDATQAVIHDQEEAGLDIVTDGQMSYDDYVGVIGSFCWYMYERIDGFEDAKEEHPSAVGAATRTKEVELLDDWGGVRNTGPVERGPIRLTDLYKVATRYANKPVKVSVGAGPVNLAWHVYFEHYEGPRELSYALAPDLQRGDEGPGRGRGDLPADRGSRSVAAAVHDDEKDYEWIADVIAQCVDGVDAKIAWHFCFGNAWGNALSGLFPPRLRDRAPLLLRRAGRPVRARFRQPRDGGRRLPHVASCRQGGRDRRDRRAHDHGRDARAGR